MTLQSEADELYGMLPDEFTAHRNAQAKAARAGGDRELADRIRKLPKPRMTAWVLNLLVRRLPGEVDELVDLGARLREAQASLDGDNVRALNDQRRQLTASLTRQARTIAADLGHQVGDEQAAEVENTLRAAMADPAGGAALRTGLLVDSFGSTGFEPVEIERVVAVPEAVVVPPPSASSPRPRLEVVRQPAATPTKRTASPAERTERPRKRPAVPKEQPAPPAKKPPTKRPAPDTRARVQAQQALQEARDTLDRAIRTLTEATQSHGDATERREELETERSTVQERLRTLDRELTRAHRAEDKAERGQERAEREVARAKRAAERAERRVERPADGETASSE